MMVGTPAVSVVMAVHNGAAQLPATVESVLRQRAVEFEFIIVDDGSTDSTPEILDDYAGSDRRVKIIRQSRNTGLTRALIAGCDTASTPFIARQDVGDLSSPLRLHSQVNALSQNEHLAFLSCWTQYVAPEGELLFIKRGGEAEGKPIWILDDSLEWGLKDGPTHHGSVMFRRSCYQRVGGYRKEFYFAQDWDLWYRLAAVGQFVMIPEVLYTARVAEKSISSLNRLAQQRIARLSRAALSRRIVGEQESDLLKQIAKIRNTTIDAKAEVKAESKGLYFIGGCLHRRSDARAQKYLQRAVNLDFMNWRAWIRILHAKLTLEKRDT